MAVNTVLTEQIKLVSVKPSTAISSDTTTAGTEVDCTGYSDAIVVLEAHAVTAGDIDITIEDGDVSGTTSAVNTKFLIGDGQAALGAVGFKHVGVSLRKPYLQVDLVSDNSANLTASAHVILYNGTVTPNFNLGN